MLICMIYIGYIKKPQGVSQLPEGKMRKQNFKKQIYLIMQRIQFFNSTFIDDI